MFEFPRRGQREERIVVDEIAACKAKLPQALSFRKEGVYWAVCDQVALLQVDLEDPRAVVGEGENGGIVELCQLVEFQL